MDISGRLQQRHITVERTAVTLSNTQELLNIGIRYRLSQFKRLLRSFFNKTLDLLLRTKDSISLQFSVSFFSLIDNIPRFLPECIGDSLLLDTEARQAKASSIPSRTIWTLRMDVETKLRRCFKAVFHRFTIQWKIWQSADRT